MRKAPVIAVIFVLLVGCVPQTARYQSTDYLPLADGTHAFSAAARDNLRLLRTMDEEERRTSLALAFVRSADKNNLQLPPPNFPQKTMTSMMAFLQALEEHTESLVFSTNEPQADETASRLAQFLHARHAERTIATGLQQSHKIMRVAIGDFCDRWNSQAMRSLPQDIVATLDANEERLLLISKSKADEAASINLYEQVLRHLQKRDLRQQFLQNWQEVAALCDKMLAAHAVLAEQKHDKQAMRDFLYAATALQDRSENLVFAYGRQK